MKRVIAVVLMCLLAANVGGFSITHHFCGKKLQYTSFAGKKKNHSCCCKGDANDRGCCKTKVLKIKLDESKQVSKVFLAQPQLIVADVLPQAPSIASIPRLSIYESHAVPCIHPPPLILPVRKHVLHQVFLIWFSVDKVRTRIVCVVL